MSNNEICLFVYHNYNIKGICYKLGVKRDINDLEQIVYDIILHYDNYKLNKIFYNGAMLSFIFRCTVNQLSVKDKTEWTMLDEYCDFNESMDVIENDYDMEKEDMLRFIDIEFRNISQSRLSKMSNEERKYYVEKLLLKNKVLRNWTLDDMKDKIGIGRNSINDLIQNAKKELKQNYEYRKNDR